MKSAVRLFAFRNMLRVAGLSALLLLLLSAGCGTGRKPPVTLRFWNGFTGPDGRTMLKLVKQFNAENPDVDVVMQRLEWATYYKKLFVAGIGNRAPEVFVLHTNALLRFAEARFVQPLDALVGPGSGLDSNDLDPNVWRASQIHGQHYGWPLDVHSMGMYYNRKLFREAGIVDAQGEPTPPRTGAEFMSALRKLTKARGANGSPQWGFVFANPSGVAYTFMRQFGGEMFTPDQSRCIVNNPQNVAALQYCVDLIRKEKVAPPPEGFDAWVGFRQGKIGIAFEGIYMLSDLQKQADLDFAGAPVPQVGANAATWTGSHNLCLRADITPTQRQAAMRFIRFLADHSLDWAAGGQVPARRSLRSAPRFQAMSVQSQFAKEVPYANYTPQLPFILEYNAEFDYAIERALRGTVTPQQALDDLAANVNKIIERRREDLQLAHAAQGGA